MAKVGVEGAKLVAAVAAGFWAYWLFFKQRTIAPRIEFEVSCRFLGPQEGSFVAEYTLTFMNKGLVRQIIRDLKLTVRGIKRDVPLEYYRPGTLSFPEGITNVENLLTDMEYMFVEPGVNQNLRHFSQVGSEFSFIRVNAEFLYSENLEHSAARVFEVKASEPEEEG